MFTPVVLAILTGCVTLVPPGEPPAALVHVLTPDRWMRPYTWSRRQSRSLSVYMNAPRENQRAFRDSLLDTVLRNWSATGPVELTRSWRPETADVRLYWTQSLPPQHPGVTILRPNSRGELVGADVWISLSPPARSDATSDRVLYGVLAHEMGHALGLPHTLARDQLMNEVLYTLDITPADIARLHALRQSGS